MKKTRIILLTVLFILATALLFAFVFFLKYFPLPSDANIPNWLLEYRVEGIVEKYGKSSSTCQIISSNDLSTYKEISNTGRKVFGDLDAKESALFIEFYGKSKNYHQPIEISSIMHSYLYMKDKSSYDVVKAVVCISRNDEPFSVDSTCIIISLKELEKIYNDCTDTTNIESTVQEMTEQWLKTNAYNRDQLKTENPLNAEYFSEWNHYVNSTDKKFQLGYSYKRNKLHIYKLTGSAEEYPNVVMSSNLIDFEIPETGWIFGAWDSDNNIWLFGEEIGLKKLGYDGVKSWKFEEMFDYDEVPMVLQNIKIQKDKGFGQMV